jgi:hypothetical protein
MPDSDVAAQQREAAPAWNVAVPYRTPARSLGLRPGISLDKALRLAAQLDDAELFHSHRCVRDTA